MFTGIVQAIGKVREPENSDDGVRLTILAPISGSTKCAWATRSP